MGGANALETVALRGSASVVVMRGLLSERWNMEGMLRQVVGDGSMKVIAARMSEGIVKCMLLEMTLTTKTSECYRSCGTNVVTNTCWQSLKCPGSALAICALALVGSRFVQRCFSISHSHGRTRDLFKAS